MSETLISVGLDVGTTTTQMILSKLSVENRATGFAVPEMIISNRQVFYESAVHFTPLAGKDLVDAKGVRAIVEAEYQKAGIRKEQVDTGAVIITGETSRKENAKAVLDAVAAFAGDFVVATAGPDLESVLAAKGAGAVAYSEKTGKRVLHMDIGGGTSNLALIENGTVVKTGCLNVGGRLLKIAEGKVTYVSPVLTGLTHLQVGNSADPEQIRQVADILVQALEMAAGLREKTVLLDKLWTEESGESWVLQEKAVISFSGGVADCIDAVHPDHAFGDIGPVLGQAIAKSLLCQNEYRTGEQTIRATVIGAGCHSAKLSGSTVFYSGVQLPVKNLPVAVFSREEQDREDLPLLIEEKRRRSDSDTVVLALPGYQGATYGQITQLAERIVRGVKNGQVLVCLEADMAKALGQKLQLLLPDRPCLCIDRVLLTEGSFLDVGKPVGPALPVVIKTLILSNGGSV